MWVAFALTFFFSKKNQHICVSLDVNFNESLTNDIVSFEQLGPDHFSWEWQWADPILRGTGTLSLETTLSKVCASLLKMVFSKRKEFALKKSKFFPLREDPFLEGV